MAAALSIFFSGGTSMGSDGGLRSVLIHIHVTCDEWAGLVR